MCLSGNFFVVLFVDSCSIRLVLTCKGSYLMEANFAACTDSHAKMYKNTTLLLLSHILVSCKFGLNKKGKEKKIIFL